MNISFRAHDFDILRPSQDQFGTSLGPLWGHFGASLGPVWDHFGASLGPLWYQFGTISVCVSNRPLLSLKPMPISGFLMMKINVRHGIVKRRISSRWKISILIYVHEEHHVGS